MKKMKGKILAILMSLAMVFTMMPMMGGQRSYADDSQGAAKAAMVMGADVLAEGTNTADAPTVYMADIPWRVIGYGGAEIASSASTMTLISNENLKIAVKFNEDMNAEDANHYSNSILKSEVDAVTDTFSPGEKAGIVVRTLESGEFKRMDTDCVAGDMVNAPLWPLSIKEAGAMNEELCKVVYTHEFDPALQGWENYWWLRSPGSGKWAGAVTNRGEIPAGLTIGFPVNNDYGVRPAFNYNLKRVAFTTAATGGKVSGEVGASALATVGTKTGSEWKLTIKDSDHQNFEATPEVSVPCGSNELSIGYSGAKTGEHEYISAIIKDKDGNVTYYGRLAQSTRASGSVNVNVDGKLGESDTLCVFNEQVNEDTKSDYTSELFEIKITKTHNMDKTDKVDPKCTNAGTEAYWTCSDCGIMFSDEAATTEIQEPVTIPAKGHTWDAGKVTKKATEKATGVKTYTCTVCKATKTETIPKLKTTAVTGKVTILNTIANSARKTNDVIWDKSKVKGATNYEINWKMRGASKWASKTVGNTVRGTTSGLTIKGLYEIRVRPVKKATSTSTYTTNARYGLWSNTIYRYFHTTEKIRLASKSKRSFTMSWKRNPEVTGYQVMFTTNSNGKGAAKNINTVGKDAISFTKSGLKSGTTYYVQIRELKKVGNNTYVGNISCPVAVKVR